MNTANYPEAIIALGAVVFALLVEFAVYLVMQSYYETALMLFRLRSQTIPVYLERPDYGLARRQGFLASPGDYLVNLEFKWQMA